MTIEKKKLYSYEEVTTSLLADKIPTLQGGVNKVTTLQKIYNLFKNSFDSVYTTASFATNAAAAAAATRIPKQSTELVEVDLLAGLKELTPTSCILSIVKIPGGTGNKEIKLRLDTENWSVLDIVSAISLYKGFDLNIRSCAIYEETEIVYLSIYINVHAGLTEPVLIALNKIN